MGASDPAEAVQVLDLLLKFFGDGERWVKGRLSDRRGNGCLVGALDFVSSHHAIQGGGAERYLADEFRRRSALRQPPRLHRNPKWGLKSGIVGTDERGRWRTRLLFCTHPISCDRIVRSIAGGNGDHSTGRALIVEGVS